MEQFVNHIIKDLDTIQLDLLQNYVYIFPTRRGGIHFQNALLHHFQDKTFIAPRIYSIQNFVEFVTGRKTTDEMTLLFELYDVYLKFDQQLETFDKFYPWGEVLLKDFDEIDKYLVNAKDLYKNIFDLKKIEATYGLEEDAVEAVRNFRKVISAEDQTELLQKFLTIWEVVGEVYYAFKMALQEKKMAYEGMLYREMVEIVRHQADRFKDNHLVFCGFNALSNAEEEIFDQLLKQKRVTFYWDADKMMLENNWHESGLFLRKYKTKWRDPDSIWITTDFVNTPKKIEIIEAVQNMAQVKTAATILEQLANEQNIEGGDSVVVLADENLLFPMLYGMPENINTINVSIGYPALESHLAMLINNIFQLHITKKRGMFKVEFIERICASGYFQLIDKDGISDLRLQLLTNRRSFITLEFIEGILNNEMILSIFDPVRSSKDFLKLLSEFMRGLFAFFIQQTEQGSNKVKQVDTTSLQQQGTRATQESNSPTEQANQQVEQEAEPLETVSEITELLEAKVVSEKALSLDDNALRMVESIEKNPRFIEEEITKLPYREEMDFLFYVIKHLLEFQDHLEDHLPRIKLPLLKKMFNESLTTLKIPFEGKTDIGLQMMGFLETRTLDFENLLILSVNEGQLPTERKLNSFIPFSLRKAFKMPTFEEQDAIYAYHFYRLLQRTKNVFLLYDGELGGNSKERSRYIPQLIRLAEQVKEQGKLQVILRQVNTVNNPIDKKEATIEIEKTEEVLELLDAYIDPKEDPKEIKKAFAPTTLTTYIRCPLQFYFKHVAQLKQEKDYTKEIEASDIGTIVHDVLENLYKPLLTKELTVEDIEKLNQPDKIKQEIESVLRKNRFIEKDYSELIGRNVITFNICRQIIESVLEKDKDFVPFKIKSVEKQQSQLVSLEINAQNVIWLKGRIDRVDQLLETEITASRIVDYKTGKTKPVKKNKKDSTESYLETFFKNPDFSAAFQAYFYAYLFYRNHPNEPIQTGIYALQEISKGVQILPPEHEPIPQELFMVYEQQLKELVRELIDPTIPFKQTEDVKRCAFCDYREICER